ncbi:MAG TPA: response regulator [Terriglobales bacterium]|nr:response regulator [Terriglobales bacterium]
MKPKTERGRILVVDDEPSVLLTYKLILEQQGYDVLAASSSSEARKTIEQENIDLLLCDLSLEERHTGFEVIEFARLRQPAAISVLLTGYASRDVSEQAGQGGVAVLFKPIDIEEFLSTISAQLKKRHEQSKKTG